jgi:hypothetical protein
VPPEDDLALRNRLDDLERELRQLRARVTALERRLGTTTGEHASDRSVVREKAVYDWQG